MQTQALNDGVDAANSALATTLIADWRRVVQILERWNGVVVAVPTNSIPTHWVGPANAAYRRALEDLHHLTLETLGRLDDARDELAQLIARVNAHV